MDDAVEPLAAAGSHSAVGIFRGLDESKLLFILDGVPARIAYIDRNRRHVYANREYCDNLGLSEKQIIGRTIADILGEASYEKLKAFGERALTGETVAWEGWIHYPQLGERYVQRNYRPYINPDGSIDGYFVLVRDRTDVKRQEEALERERIRLLDAVESSSEGFALWDRDDRLVMCNSRYREMYAMIGPENLSPGVRYRDSALALVRNGGTLLPPDQAEAYVEERVAFRRNPGPPFDVEREGGRWVRVIDRKTAEGGTVSIRLDVTDLKRREGILTVVNEAASRILSSGSWRPSVEDMLSRLGRVIAVSRVTLSQNRIAENGEYLQTDLFEWDAPGMRRVMDAEALQGFDIKDDAFQDWRARRSRGEVVWAVVKDLPDDQRRWMELQGVKSLVRVPIMAGGAWWGTVGFDACLEERVWGALEIETLRAVAGLIGVAIAHDRTLEALRESEQRFRGIAEAHPVPLLIARSDDGAIVYASPRCTGLFGRPQAQIVGRRLEEFLPDDLRHDLSRGATDEQGIEGELRAGDGGDVPVLIAVEAITYEGHPAMVLGFLDLTERKAAEREIAQQRERLHQSEKMSALGSLLAGVAHELNNPLSIVVGQALMLEEEDGGANSSRASKIRAAAERCGRIVKTFLAMARQRGPEKRAADLNEIVRSALDLVGYAMRTSGIVVETRLGAALPALDGDPDQLGQVVMNLLINAQQALKDAPDPRRVSVRTAYDAARAMLRLTLSDNGPGIPAALRSRIFEPFFTTKPVGSGTGVGLSVCHAVVGAHGGTIAFEETPGGGATFVVTLPAGQGLPRGAASAAVPAARAPRGRALVVDDEPEIAELIGEILTVDGFTVDIATSGTAALARIVQQTYDVVLSDVRMPQLDGTTLYARLAAERPKLADRLIFVTGDTLGLGAGSAIHATGRPVIEKPITPQDVRRAVQAMLGEARATSAGSIER